MESPRRSEGAAADERARRGGPHVSEGGRRRATGIAARGRRRGSFTTSQPRFFPRAALPRPEGAFALRSGVSVPAPTSLGGGSLSVR